MDPTAAAAAAWAPPQHHHPHYQPQNQQPDAHAIMLVQQQIEACVLQAMSKWEIVAELQQASHIRQGVTLDVWNRLAEQNTPYFAAYEQLIRLRNQVRDFNDVMAKLLAAEGSQGGLPAPRSSSSGQTGAVQGLATDQAALPTQTSAASPAPAAHQPAIETSSSSLPNGQTQESAPGVSKSDAQVNGSEDVPKQLATSSSSSSSASAASPVAEKSSAAEAEASSQAGSSAASGS